MLPDGCGVQHVGCVVLSYYHSTMTEGHLIERQCLDVKVVGLTLWAGVSDLHAGALSLVSGMDRPTVALWHIELFRRHEYQRLFFCCCCANLLVRSAWW